MHISILKQLLKFKQLIKIRNAVEEKSSENIYNNIYFYIFSIHRVIELIHIEMQGIYVQTLTTTIKTTITRDDDSVKKKYRLSMSNFSHAAVSEFLFRL